MPESIRVERLSKAYRSRDGSEIKALRDISFTVDRGEFVSIVGQSGCGKSSLLKILAGLLSKSSGVISIEDRELDGPRSDIGLMFQKPLLLEWRRVLDNVLLPVEIYRLDRKEYEKKARRLLDTAGLADFLTKYPFELSGGMQQRVALCRALVAEPSLLLMDEPFGALDTLTRQRMGFELLRLWEEWKSTVLFVTHDVDEAVMLSDRVLVMSSRPGTVLGSFTVDLPRPRQIFIKDTAEFIHFSSRIRRCLWEEAADA
ncbi:MAG TPA: ABC transporter ATP-binding protein [Candidatus Binatia bacterium]|nr:ABC transporter ATP-binding protein [Candidatus Binatia bacterium]